MEWEYITHRVDLGASSGWSIQTGEFDAGAITGILNWYGAQQWELVSTFTTAYYQGGTTRLGLVFKRPRQATMATMAPPVQTPPK